MKSADINAFLIDIFHKVLNGRSVIYAIGKLENGETFALLDDEFRSPHFFIREEDQAQFESLATRQRPKANSSNNKTMDQSPLIEISAATVQSLSRLRRLCEEHHLRTYEADIRFTDNFLMENEIMGSFRMSGEWRASEQVDRFYRNPKYSPSTWQPDLSILSLDIETNETADEVYGISLVSYSLSGKTLSEQMLIVGEPDANDHDWIRCFTNEESLLLGLSESILAINPDLITGWSVIDFDLAVLAKRYQAYSLPMQWGRSRDIEYTPVRVNNGRTFVSIRGRQVLDGLRLIRSTAKRFDDYRLGTVAQQLLGRGKTLQPEEWESMPDAITRAFKEDRNTFCEYCLEDSRLVREILAQEGLIELSIIRSQLIGLPLDRNWGSVASFEFLYIKELHERNRAAPTMGIDILGPWGAPGGLVMEPATGLHRHILLFDFKSLYPSIIRTFGIDPLAYVEGLTASETDVMHAPNDAAFLIDEPILPRLLDRFWDQREQAKARGDAVASYSYKIIMNSFYGVLGSQGCRFSARDIAGAITGFGQFFLKWTKAFLSDLGYTVLYGDTDSLFVDCHLNGDTNEDEARSRGVEIREQVNRALETYIAKEYQVESKLELEFETYYRFLILPPDRGGQKSRAKNYAGLKCANGQSELEIKGMEAVRSDWTPFAQDLQVTLFKMIFAEAAPEEIEAILSEKVLALREGKCDEQLVYRKRIRKPLDQYIKTTPPQVRAARLLPKPVRQVRYVITTAGPEPLGFVKHPIDYDHYINKQVIPLIENLAPMIGLNVKKACGLPEGQRRLF